MRGFDHKKIEKKWQEKWEEDGLHTTPDERENKENFYLLTEFPYPSGNLHTGHWYAFAIPDIYARFLRMQGKNVLYPVGFDAFGLPAENAAIKRGINPREWTFKNMEDMRAQLRSMGASFDWSREVVTCDPAYYKWTQWMFTKMFEKGLAYQKETQVNWCPSCKTVLANEQILTRSTDSGQAGMCERCESEVERREMLQWNLKITDYAERLLDDLEELDWPEEIKTSQKNWIGKSEGAEISFDIPALKQSVKVFTTRPDTLFGATYLVLAPEHKAISQMQETITNWSEIEKYIKDAGKKTDIERTAERKDTSTGSVQVKTGVKVEGVTATNPATKEEVPIFVADYVLGHVGTGAIMAVPAHDERDWEFAKKYDLPIKQVITAQVFDESNPPREGKEDTQRTVVHCILRNPKDNTILLGFLKDGSWGDRKPINFVIGGVEGREELEEAGRREIREETGYTDVRFVQEIPLETEARFFQAQKDVNRRVHVHTLLFELESDVQEEVSEEEKAKHEFKWIPANEVAENVNIPDDTLTWSYYHSGGFAYTGEGTLVHSSEFSGLSSEEAKEKITKFVGGEMKTTYKLRDWTVSRQRYWGVPIPIIHCEKCGAVPVPEKDLPLELPEIDDYLPTGDGKSPLAKAGDWVEVECPKCDGEARRETDTLDTFVDSSWYFLRYTDSKNDAEFAAKEKQAHWMPVDLYSGGAEHTTMHLLYSRFWHKALFDMDLVAEKEPYTRRMNRGLILGPDGNKMSKSKGNVIDPDEYVERLGADTVRMYLAFIGPYNETGQYPWNPDSIVGVRRFLEKVKAMSGEFAESDSTEIEPVLHQTIKRVGESIETLKMNTGVSQLMTFINVAGKHRPTKGQWETFIRLLAPFAPHLAEEVWCGELGYADSVHMQSWPQYDEAKIQEEEVTLAVQVNGKVRGEVVVPADAKQEDIEKQAKEIVASWLEGKEIKRVIFVPSRLVNFVMS